MMRIYEEKREFPTACLLKLLESSVGRSTANSQMSTALSTKA